MGLVLYGYGKCECHSGHRWGGRIRAGIIYIRGICLSRSTRNFGSLERDLGAEGEGEKYGMSQQALGRIANRGQCAENRSAL
jgi:hypothetical protein